MMDSLFARVDLDALVRRGYPGEKKRPPVREERRSTPWGMSDYAYRYDESGQVTFYVTPGHGGFKLSADANRRVAPELRRRGGWYEEDCESYIVVVTFPELFTRDHVRAAIAGIRAWFPDEFTAWCGLEVTADQSSVVARREHLARHADHPIGHTAWGDWADWVPDGMVGVAATTPATGEETWWLVDKDRYDGRDPHGYVVDPAVDSRITRPAAA